MQRKITTITAKQNISKSCCAYIRVSTDKDDQEESYYCQQQYWQKKLANEPDTQFLGVFGDEGISGKYMKNRPQFLEMIKQAKLGNINTIYTKSFARFGRNFNETISTIRELRNIGVTVVFENDNLNTASMNDELLLKLKSILAEEYSKTNKKNVTWSARKRYSEGSVELNSQIMGYDFKNGKLTINEEQAKIVKLIFSLRDEGMGFNAISNYLMRNKIPTATGKQTWSPSVIKRMLLNEKYIGDALLQKKYTDDNFKQQINKGEVKQYYVENDHEPIISKEQFYRVKQKIYELALKYPTKKDTIRYELSGKIKCAKCGKSYKRVTNVAAKNVSPITWTCYTKFKQGISICDSPSINDDLIKAIIVDAYNEYLTTPKHNEQTRNIEEELKRLKETETNLRELFIKGVYNINQYNKQIQKIKKKFIELDQLLSKAQGYEFYKKNGQQITGYSPEIVNDHIEQILIDSWQIKVQFKNQQIITKEFKYEHRKYCKNY